MFKRSKVPYYVVNCNLGDKRFEETLRKLLSTIAVTKSPVHDHYDGTWFGIAYGKIGS